MLVLLPQLPPSSDQEERENGCSTSPASPFLPLYPYASFPSLPLIAYRVPEPVTAASAAAATAARVSCKFNFAVPVSRSLLSLHSTAAPSVAWPLLFPLSPALALHLLLSINRSSWFQVKEGERERKKERPKDGETIKILFVSVADLFERSIS